MWAKGAGPRFEYGTCLSRGLACYQLPVAASLNPTPNIYPFNYAKFYGSIRSEQQCTTAPSGDCSSNSAAEPACTTVFDTVTDNECSTVFEQSCQTVTEQDCSKSGAPVCRTVTEQVCQTVTDPCTPGTEQQCSTVQEQQCQTVSQQECQVSQYSAGAAVQEQQCQTVSQQECQVSQYSAGAAVPDSQPGGVPGESVLCRSAR